MELSAVKWYSLAYGRCPAASLTVTALSSSLFWRKSGVARLHFMEVFEFGQPCCSKCSPRRMQFLNWGLAKEISGCKLAAAKETGVITAAATVSSKLESWNFTAWKDISALPRTGSGRSFLKTPKRVAASRRCSGARLNVAPVGILEPQPPGYTVSTTSQQVRWPLREWAETLKETCNSRKISSKAHYPRWEERKREKKKKNGLLNIHTHYWVRGEFN